MVLTKKGSSGRGAGLDLLSFRLSGNQMLFMGLKLERGLSGGVSFRSHSGGG